MKQFHDYLILKVDPANSTIVDGYQYTMEWTGVATDDLYRVTNKNIKIQNALSVDSLEMKLVNADDDSDWKHNLKDGGIISLR